MVEGAADRPVVVLDPIEPGAGKPEYCIHGRVTCVGCGDWCWLGHQTYEAVSSGAVAPVCKPCAGQYIPAGLERSGNIQDHRRADGPH